jgi:prolipoprotein diacylglyceryltransferase
MGMVLAIWQRSPAADRTASGVLFRLFLIGYLGFRFLVEFIKPSDKPLLGLSAIQIACLTTVIVCIFQLRRSRLDEIGRYSTFVPSPGIPEEGQGRGLRG